AIMNYCSDCIEVPFNFSKGFSLYHYNDNMKKILYNIKFSNNPWLGEYMGKKLGEALLNGQWLTGIHIIIPVPLHTNRLKTRGYNQSSMIAQGIMYVFKDSE